MLPSDGLVLDVGCGPGRDAKVFTEQGLRVIGIDFSPEMIALAKHSAPIARFEVMAMEELTFLSGTFDGVWAGASLLHMPKNKFSSVLAQIHRVLKHGGIFYLSLKEGKGEGLEPDTRYGGLEKFWSYFERDELTVLLQQAGFSVIEMWRKGTKVSYETHPMLQVFCKKNRLKNFQEGCAEV